MASLKLIFNFYRFFFTIYLVPFPLRPQLSGSTCSKWVRWTGNVCHWVVNAFLVCNICLFSLNFVISFQKYYYTKRYTYCWHFNNCYLLFSLLLSLSALLYLRIVSRKLKFGQTLAAILKLHEKNLTGEKNNLGISKYLYFSLLVLPLQTLKNFLAFLDYALLVRPVGLDWIFIFAFMTVPYFLYYLLAHSCLFFSVLMRVLTEVLRPPFTGSPMTPRAYRKYMLLYEEVRKLAAQVNRMFSPLLLLAYVTSVMGASMIMALTATPYAVNSIELFDFAVVNVIASVMCLNCVIRCNKQRGNYLNLLHFELSNRTDKRLILCELDFNARLIERLLREEEWFNVGCFISVDESLLLTVFQMLYDTTLGFNNLTVDKESVSKDTLEGFLERVKRVLHLE